MMLFGFVVGMKNGHIAGTLVALEHRIISKASSRSENFLSLDGLSPSLFQHIENLHWKKKQKSSNIHGRFWWDFLHLQFLLSF